MKIIGAGMAGLLAARMLSRRNPVILEKSEELPNNHSAVLRFASSKVADVLGISFKKVQLVKTVVPWRNPVADAMAYSYKVLGEYRSDRSVLLPERWTSSERYIAPENLIEQMADGVRIEYGIDYAFPENEPKVISTIPMPILARAMGYKDLGWKYVHGMNIVARLINTEAYVSVMVPAPQVPFYRASITGSQLIVELSRAGQTAKATDVLTEACKHLGITDGSIECFDVVQQKYAKIAPIDEGERRNFIYWASTVTGRAYQLGRFATWRPKLLLDDLVQDVRLIESWMNSPSPAYDMQLHERRA